MSGFSPAHDGATAAASAASGFTVKARKTRKARHKDDRARVTAHARAVGRTGKTDERRLEEPAEPQVSAQDQVPVVPRHGNAEPGEAREHLRRDIGSRVAVFELGAPDNPEDLSGPFRDPAGAEMGWASRCLTHDETKYFGRHRAAVQAAKASHSWCAGCAAAAANSRRVRHRARARLREAMS